MSNERPAFSGPFSPEGLQIVSSIDRLEDITPEWAWGGSTGKGVKVAVIDSGIDATHPGVGRPIKGYVAVSSKGEEIIYDTEPHTDPYSHGTACATIIRSFAPDCELYSVKVIGADLIGRGKIFAAGLKWAIENGMHVCNMSLGTTKKDFYSVLHQLTDFAYFNNVILVTAANNMPIPSFPSVYSSVISVGSHDLQDPYLFYYNPNPPVEFGASGINIRVAWLRGGWITATGNSYATPHITGLVTKILGKHPDLTLFQVKSILRALAANVSHDPRPAASGNTKQGIDGIEWNNWDALPGDVRTDLAVSTIIFGNRLYIFAIGSADQQIYVNTFDGQRISGWVADPGGTTNVHIAATVVGSYMYVFRVGVDDHRIYVKRFDGDTVSEWSHVPGNATTHTALNAAALDNRLFLFHVGIDDYRIYVNSFDDSSWSGWTVVPGEVTTGTAVTSIMFNHRLYLFAVGSTDQQIHFNSFDGSNWSGWISDPSGGTTDAALAATVFGSQLYLFRKGPKDQQIYVDTSDGNTVSGWSQVPGGVPIDAGVATTVFGNQLYLFCAGADDHRIYARTMK